MCRKERYRLKDLGYILYTAGAGASRAPLLSLSAGNISKHILGEILFPAAKSFQSASYPFSCFPAWLQEKVSMMVGRQLHLLLAHICCHLFWPYPRPDYVHFQQGGWLPLTPKCLLFLESRHTCKAEQQRIQLRLRQVSLRRTPAWLSHTEQGSGTKILMHIVGHNSYSQAGKCG